MNMLSIFLFVLVVAATTVAILYFGLITKAHAWFTALGHHMIAQKAIRRMAEAPADAPAPRGVAHPPGAATLAILDHIGKTLRGSPTVLTGWCIPIILLYTFVVASWYGRTVDLSQTVALIGAMALQGGQRLLTKKIEKSDDAAG